MSKQIELAILETILYSKLDNVLSESKNYSQILNLIEFISEKRGQLINEDASEAEARAFAQEIRDGEYNETKARRITYNIKKNNAGLVDIINAMREVARKESGGDFKNLTPTILSMVGILYPIFEKQIQNILNNDKLTIYIKDKTGKIVGQEQMSKVRSVVDLYKRKNSDYPLDVRMEAVANMLINKDEDATSFKNAEAKIYNGLLFALPKVARFYQTVQSRMERDTEGEGEGSEKKVGIFGKLKSDEKVDFELKSAKESPAIKHIAKVLKKQGVGRMTEKQIENYFMIPLEYKSCLTFANMISRPGIENIYVGKDIKFIDIIKDNYGIDPDSKDKGQVYNTNNRKIADALKKAIESGELDDFEETFKTSLSDISKVLCTGENEKYRIQTAEEKMKKEKEAQEQETEEEEDEYTDSEDLGDKDYSQISSQPEKLSLEKMTPFQRTSHITMTLLRTNKPEGFLPKFEKYLKELSKEQKDKILAKHPSLEEKLNPFLSESTKNRFKLLSGIVKLNYE